MLDDKNYQVPGERVRTRLVILSEVKAQPNGVEGPLVCRNHRGR